jgi:tRNA pseudouridine38-40 synthase
VAPVRIALGIEYDGAGFNGWQTQPDRRSIQDALESALAALAQDPISTICAGRTDAGVHAIDQVVHFDTGVERPLGAWIRGTNRFLPPSVAVRWARLVSDDFHARFGALRRSYDYWILNDAVRSPLAHTRATWVFQPLDTAAMEAAARLLIGSHDFTSFRSAECQAVSPVRDLQRLDVQRFGRWILVRATANAFLHHMVRNLAGALVAVGIGRYPAEWVADLLAARDRSKGAPTLGAPGLYLARVEYDARFNLPAPDTALPQRFDAYANQDLWPDS